MTESGSTEQVVRTAAVEVYWGQVEAWLLRGGGEGPVERAGAEAMGGQGGLAMSGGDDLEAFGGGGGALSDEEMLGGIWGGGLLRLEETPAGEKVDSRPAVRSVACACRPCRKCTVMKPVMA